MTSLEIPDTWTPKFFEDIKQSARAWRNIGGRHFIGAEWVQYKPQLGDEPPTMAGGVDKTVIIPANIGTVIKINVIDCPVVECRVRLESEFMQYLRSRYPTYSQYFPHVLYVHPQVALMQKLRIDELKFGQRHREIKKIGDKIGVRNDVHAGNIGWLGDKWFFIDIAHDLGELDYKNGEEE